jgi:DNA-binding CsgD family transcriptional regulator
VPTPLTDRFVGRSAELEAASELLAGGEGQVLLLTGEAGIGKTRFAREVAGRALALGTAVVWGRCAEDEGAPAYWPWRQVVATLGADPEQVFGGGVESPDQRFRVVDDVRRLLIAAGRLLVVLDDLHAADRPSVSLLSLLSDVAVTHPVLVLATAREVTAPLADVLRGPATDRWELRQLGVLEVAEQLPSPDLAAAVHAVTGGNPMFVREVARAVADGTWDPSRPPRTVVDAVAARLDRLSPACRAALQTAAVAGRDLDLPVVAKVLQTPVEALLPLVDEAVAQGLVDGDRFTHMLTRDAVELTLTPSQRVELHAAVGAAVRLVHADRLDDHLADLVRHAQAAGDPAGIVTWARSGGAEAERRLAFEEAVRLYRLAGEHAPDDTGLLHALARSAYYAGDLATWVGAARRAAELAGSAEELAEAALLLETSPDTATNELIDELCTQALAGQLPDAVRARLLALHSQVAFYASDPVGTGRRSAEALALARTAHDDRALVAALRARWEALPGRAGRAERWALADELVAIARRLGSPLNEKWVRLWQGEVRIEVGEAHAAADLLPGLRSTVERVGGPVASWHADRVSACVAQMEGRFAEAAALSRAALERMLPIEPAPARGAWFAMQYALSRHVPVEPHVLEAARAGWGSPPQFRTMALLSRAMLLSSAGERDAARALYLQAGPPAGWRLPVFFVVPGRVAGLVTALNLDLADDAAELASLLEPERDEFAVGGAVSCLGPVSLTLGRAELALGRRAQAAQSLRSALASAERCGLPAFAAEARLLLAEVLPPGAEATALARAGADTVRALGITTLHVTRPANPLSAREQEVAALVARGLSNRQIAEQLFLSERTAQNHVQHILTKLDLSNRAQIATWWMSTGMSNPADSGDGRSPAPS